MARTGRHALQRPADRFAIPADWDTWIAGQGAGGGYCQTSFWAEIFVAAHGGEAYALSVEEQGQRVAGALLTRRPAQKKGAVGRIKGWLTGDSLECFEGPVLTGPNKTAHLRSLLEDTDTLASALGVPRVHFFGRPPAAADWPAAETTSVLFEEFGYAARPWLTTLIDLTTPEDELSRSFRHAARKGVRKCEAVGIRVGVCANFEEFSRDYLTPYYEAQKDEGRFAGLLANLETLWDTDGGRHYRYFIARDSEGAPLALLGTYAFNGVATEIMSVVTVSGRARKLPAQDLLHWEVFRTHKAAGDTTFNLAGFNPEPADAKESGIRRFKEKWGGQTVDVPMFFRDRSGPIVRLGKSAARFVRAHNDKR